LCSSDLGRFFDKELQDFIINENIFDINDIQQIIIDRI